MAGIKVSGKIHITITFGDEDETGIEVADKKVRPGSAKKPHEGRKRS